MLEVNFDDKANNTFSVIILLKHEIVEDSNPRTQTFIVKREHDFWFSRGYSFPALEERVVFTRVEAIHCLLFFYLSSSHYL